MTRPVARTVDADARPDAGVVIVEPEPIERVELLKEHVSTWLSVVAMLAMSGGVGWGLWARFGPYALFFGGALLATFVMISDAGRRPKPLHVAAPERKAEVPGPSSAGNLHAKGPGGKS